MTMYYFACYWRSGTGPWEAFEENNVHCDGLNETYGTARELINLVQARMIQKRNQHYPIGIFEAGGGEPIVILHTPAYPMSEWAHRNSPRLWPTQTWDGMPIPPDVVVI